MDRTFHDLCENLTSEVKQLAKKQDLTVGELDSIYKAVKTIYYIKTMTAMEEYGNESERGRMSRGYSRDYSKDYSGDYSRDSRGSEYSRGYSRDMDSTRYSRVGNHEHMIEELDHIMRQSDDPKMQDAIRECIAKLR